ncbi:glycosyl hydrolase 53 family protein [Mesoplasma seiffertii]|uniref:glycosyl hydrolase 53 family protein n=1 Tax=Mesoplasma seiffertii TaxID=28224 RepID=UPI00047D874B|nr:glycosyl hydrolase 53 family protein [Mesoplasma seiffertii]
MKNSKLKPIMAATLIFISAGLSVFASSCSLSKWTTDFPKNGKTITNKEFIKGVDISSYAEIVEQSTLKEGKTKTYKELTEDDQKIYYNFNGEQENLFKILSQNEVNSIRLRVWNDPYDSTGKSYGGGHNDIDTNIWIANQAKKNGITNVLLDFHYSDFWADPSRQWLPKQWAGISDEQKLSELVYQYTFESLKKFYDETNLIPAKVQLGNEITNGSFWDWKSSNTQYKNYQYTSRLLKQGLLAVDDFAETIKADLPVKIAKSIHIDGNISLKKWKQLLDNYLIQGELIDLVDEIGITHYPDWNGDSKHLYDVMSLIKREYNLPSFVSETAAVSTFTETNLAGDITTSQHNPGSYYNTPDAGTQITLINSIMEAASQALPDDETGIYWWEPAWILANKSGWATREGIIYSEPFDKQKQKDFKTGNSWWNSGVFTSEAKPLPVLKALKNFKRINQSSDKLAGDQISNKTIFKAFKNDPILKFAKITGFKKALDINESIDHQDLTIKQNQKPEDIYKAFLEANPRIIEQHVKYDGVEWNQEQETGILKVTNSQSNTIYQDFQLRVPYTIVKEEENTYKINETIEIAANDTNWLSQIIEAISRDINKSKEVENFIYESIKPEFYKSEWYSWAGIANKALVFYDNKIGENRFLDTKILKTNNTKIFRNKKVDFDYLTKNSKPWQNTLQTGQYELSLVFTKSIDFDKYGLENWKELGGFAITVKVNVS